MSVLLDLGIRLLVLAADRAPDKLTIRETAEICAASHAHLAKAANRLVKGGFLCSLRGRRGGLKLALPPEAIDLGAVVQSLLGSQPACHVRDEVLVGWRRVQEEAASAYIRHLAERTLSDIL
ncbi:Rrf2 family transcriptional regulator [Rhizobium sp. 18055]|uniref:RrF2 family transcriptional regulator n=1 Tax=Rhizobium sp. 18055 TaxID=2681403 RepID=UPI00135A5710|nr:Rrf2 family transcriptional regulator [Rhizobium sp. 18055]